MHILPILRPLIQSKLGQGGTENMAEPIVADMGVAFIPKDENQVIFVLDFSGL